MTSVDLTFSSNHEFRVSNRFARWWIRIEWFFWHLCYHDRYTGWSINNRTILNCSHFFARRYFFNPFSPKRSIHTGKLRQQHEFTNASFIILVRCHLVSPYRVDGSANNVMYRGGHFCEIAGIIKRIEFRRKFILNRRTA